MCTRLYRGFSPAFALALAIGGEMRPEKMGAEHLALLATPLGMPPRCLAGQARDMADRGPPAIDQATREIAPALTPPAWPRATRLGRGRRCRLQPGAAPAPPRSAVTSISMRMRGSISRALIMVAAGRTSPSTRCNAGQQRGNSSASGTM